MSADAIGAVSSQNSRPTQSGPNKDSGANSIAQQSQALSQAAAARAASSPEAQGKDKPVQTPKKVESSTAQQEARKKGESESASEAGPRRKSSSKVDVVA